MPGRDTDVDQQHMLLMVESAHRAGRSETEITEIVQDAVEADAELAADLKAAA